jgi:ABC-type transport system involved in multi-copper enzyme maturation permease subunit
MTNAMQLEMYQLVIDNNLLELEGDLSIQDRAYLLEQNAKFQYYIDTQTTEFDYLDYHYPTNRIIGAEWVGYMFFLGGIGAYSLYAFSVFVPSFVYGLDYESGFLKNIIAAPRSRRRIFWMKGGFSSLTIMVFGLFLFVLALILGQFDSNGQVFLLIQNGVVHTITVNQVFLAFALGQLILSAVLTSLIALIIGVKSILPPPPPKLVPAITVSLLFNLIAPSGASKVRLP